MRWWLNRPFRHSDLLSWPVASSSWPGFFCVAWAIPGTGHRLPLCIQSPGPSQAKGCHFGSLGSAQAFCLAFLHASHMTPTTGHTALRILGWWSGSAWKRELRPVAGAGQQQPLPIILEPLRASVLPHVIAKCCLKPKGNTSTTTRYLLFFFN